MFQTGIQEICLDDHWILAGSAGELGGALAGASWQQELQELLAALQARAIAAGA
jgi:hypothetical protein